MLCVCVCVCVCVWWVRVGGKLEAEHRGWQSDNDLNDNSKDSLYADEHEVNTNPYRD